METQYKGYTVYSDGRIRSKRFTNRYIQPCDAGRYLQFTIWEDSKSCQSTVHRFIWEAFNGPIPDGLTVDHIDKNKMNNNLSNLRLLPMKDNASLGSREVTDKQIQDTHYLKSLGWKQSMIAKELGLSEATISLIINKKRYYTK